MAAFRLSTLETTYLMRACNKVVLIDSDTLATLPDRELASGLSEVVKYGLIRDAAFFEWLEQVIRCLYSSLDPR